VSATSHAFGAVHTRVTPVIVHRENFYVASATVLFNARQDPVVHWRLENDALLVFIGFGHARDAYSPVSCLVLQIPFAGLERVVAAWDHCRTTRAAAAVELRVRMYIEPSIHAAHVLCGDTASKFVTAPTDPFMGGVLHMEVVSDVTSTHTAGVRVCATVYSIVHTSPDPREHPMATPSFICRLDNDHEAGIAHLAHMLAAAGFLRAVPVAPGVGLVTPARRPTGGDWEKDRSL
jgi:hypothetical protein